MTAIKHAASRAGRLIRILTLSCLLGLAGLFVGCDQPSEPVPSLGIRHAPTAISDLSAQREEKVTPPAELMNTAPAPSATPEAERHESNGDDILVRVRR
jgi:hypothetical protein